MSAPVLLLELAAAPAGARAPLDRLQAAFGFTPNLARAMAHAPAALEAYVQGLFAVGEALAPAEAQLVMLTASRVNFAGYGVAVHGALAMGAGAAPEAVALARGEASAKPDARSAALISLTEAVTRRESLPLDAVSIFSPADLVEIVFAVALKHFANTIAALSRAPIDAELQGRA